MRDRLQRANVPELEWTDEPAYVSLKVEDPDGWVVELFWEPAS